MHYETYVPSPVFLNNILIILAKGHQLCSKSICLEWRVTDNRLMLFCQIHDIHLSVFIDDPNGNILADCVPPFQSSCEAYYKNGTMNYNVSTNEVKFIVHGKISKQLNGNWTCRHGTNWDRAVALISVIKLNGMYIEYEISNQNIIKH